MNKLRHLSFFFLISAPVVTAFIGAIVYLIYGLNTVGAFITGALSLIVIAYILYKEWHANLPKETESTCSKKDILIFVAFCVSWLVSVYFLYKGQSNRPLLTPWQVVSAWYFLSYGLGVVCLFFLSKRSSIFTVPGLVMQAILLFGTAAAVYTIGYGFDPFIHEAAVRAIQELGQIIPLSPLYLGQYSLVTVAHAWTGIDAAFFAKILVPGLAALILPSLILRWLKRHHDKEQDWALAALSLFILPATIFIITTPQNLAFIFLLVVLLLPSPQITRNERILVWLAALAALVTQPIAGIPACAIALIDSFKNSTYKKKIFPIIIVLVAISLPSALYIFTKIGGNADAGISWPDFSFLLNYVPSNDSNESWWLNFVYFYQGLWGIILVGLAGTGAWIAFKKKLPELSERFAWPAIAVLTAAILTSFIDFHLLIAYEQSDYPRRIIVTAFLISLPLMLTTLRSWAARLEKVTVHSFIIWSIIIASAATASLYLSYPRFDHYHNSHGYASSQADIEAVRWIDEDAGTSSYAVLANQQVSAASLRAFGFKHYFNNNLFYYPIPTGGPLYAHFLGMVEKPNLKEIASAFKLTGAEKIYFVLNSYWWEYPRLAAEAAFIADSVKDIGDGQVRVYTFIRK